MSKEVDGQFLVFPHAHSAIEQTVRSMWQGYVGNCRENCTGAAAAAADEAGDLRCW